MALAIKTIRADGFLELDFAKRFNLLVLERGNFNEERFGAQPM